MTWLDRISYTRAFLLLASAVAFVIWQGTQLTFVRESVQGGPLQLVAGRHGDPVALRLETFAPAALETISAWILETLAKTAS